MFDSIQQEIHWLLKDTFKRFKKSENYLNYFKLSSNEESEEIEDELQITGLDRVKVSMANIFGGLKRRKPSPMKREKRERSSSRREVKETTIIFNEDFKF